MATARTRRATKKQNYAKMHTLGLQEDHNMDSDLEDGQIKDSPIQVMASDDDFDQTITEASSFSSRMRKLDHEHSDQESLDYEDDVQEEVQEERHTVPDESEGENDVAHDEVWERKQAQIVQSREKREHLRKRLERQRIEAEEKLNEEREKEELEKMEREIRHLDKQRSVGLKIKGTTGTKSKPRGKVKR